MLHQSEDPTGLMSQRLQCINEALVRYGVVELIDNPLNNQLLHVHTRIASNRWWQPYTNKAYAKGVQNVWQAVFPMTANSEPEAYDLARKEFIELAFGRQSTKQKIDGLSKQFQKYLNDLNHSDAIKAAKTMAKVLRGSKTEAEVVKTLEKKLPNIAASRIKTIVHTELTRAHAEGALDTMELMGIDKATVNVEWSTRKQGVCPMCKALKRMLLTVDQMRGLIPRHPNCKCAPIPKVVRRGRRKDFRLAIRRSVREEEKNSTRRSNWMGRNLANT